METSSIISKNIKELRVKFGYTQDFIAEYLGITPAAISQYENDARSIPETVVEKLAVLYNVEAYDMYEENPEQQTLLTTFAFRANELTASDLQSVSKFKKIITNYINMSKALANE